LHQYIQQEILGQGIGKFDIPPPLGISSYPEWKDRANTVRLGLAGVCVKCGCIVFDVKMMKQLKIVVHTRGAETYRIPFFYISVDFNGLLLKN
jgi:hypothetical protein